MIAPNLVFVVQVVFLVLQSRRVDVYWMVADLQRGLPIGRIQFGKGDCPQGGEHSGKRETTGPTLDHHPSLQ
jgi:hypothetical protein